MTLSVISSVQTNTGLRLVRPVEHIEEGINTFGQAFKKVRWIWNPGNAEFDPKRDYAPRTKPECRGALLAFQKWMSNDELIGRQDIVLTSPKLAWDYGSGRIGAVRGDYDNSFVYETVDADGNIIRRPIVISKEFMPTSKSAWRPLHLTAGNITTWSTEELSDETCQFEDWMKPDPENGDPYKEHRNIVFQKITNLAMWRTLSIMLEGRIVSVNIGPQLEADVEALRPILEAASIEEAKEANNAFWFNVREQGRDRKAEAQTVSSLIQAEGLSAKEIAQQSTLVNKMDGGQIDLRKLAAGTTVTPYTSTGIRMQPFVVPDLRKNPLAIADIVAVAKRWNDRNYLASL